MEPHEKSPRVLCGTPDAIARVLQNPKTQSQQRSAKLRGSKVEVFCSFPHPALVQARTSRIYALRLVLHWHHWLGVYCTKYLSSESPWADPSSSDPLTDECLLIIEIFSPACTSYTIYPAQRCVLYDLNYSTFVGVSYCELDRTMKPEKILNTQLFFLEWLGRTVTVYLFMIARPLTSAIDSVHLFCAENRTIFFLFTLFVLKLGLSSFSSFVLRLLLYFSFSVREVSIIPALDRIAHFHPQLQTSCTYTRLSLLPNPCS